MDKSKELIAVENFAVLGKSGSYNSGITAENSPSYRRVINNCPQMWNRSLKSVPD